MNNFVFTTFVVAAIVMGFVSAFEGKREDNGHVKKLIRLAQGNRPRENAIEKFVVFFQNTHTHTRHR